MKSSGFLLLIALVVVVQTARGQFYIRGQDPAGVRWQQIHTPNFQLIFPESYASQANRIADLMEYIYHPAAFSLGYPPRKVPVVIHNQTVIPNGFVSWAPARAELFTNPPAHDGVHPWMERLAVHEFRHVVQVDRLNYGMTGFFSRVFGEHVTGLALGLFVPTWFLEGDAVAMETALTNGGRGREPAFIQGMRAQVTQKGIFSYDKAKLGSMSNHVPNHYELGYQMVSMGRTFYGVSLWEEVLDGVARKPYTILPFRLGLKKLTGRGMRGHYRYTMAYLDSLWTDQLVSQSPSLFREVLPPPSLFTSYRSAQWIEDTVLVALVMGMEDIPRLELIDTKGRKQLLHNPGPLSSMVLSHGGELIAWSEFRRHPRWEHLTWSEIHLYDLKQGDHRRLTHQSRMFSPHLSACGSRIAVSSYSADDVSAIEVLDVDDGNTLFRIQATAGNMFMEPSWDKEGVLLTAILQNEEGKQVVLIDPETQELRVLFRAGHVSISRPRYMDNGRILFNGAFSGRDEVYVLHTQSGDVERLVEATYGAVDASFLEQGNRLVWSDYSSMGYGLALQEVDELTFTPLEGISGEVCGFTETLAGQEDFVVNRSEIPSGTHRVEDYSRLSNLFRFHSWGPYGLRMQQRELGPGLAMFSQNILSTSVASMGYLYNLTEGEGKYYANIQYMGWFPVIDFEMESGLRRAFYVEEEGGLRSSFPWRQDVVRTGVRVPLVFQRGGHHLGILPAVRSAAIRARRTKESPRFFKENRVFSMEYRITAYSQRRRVERDIRPRWGQVVDFQYRHSAFGGDMGSVLAVGSTLLFPGVARHHSLRLSGAYQKHRGGDIPEQTIHYIFPNLIAYPRGSIIRRDDVLQTFTADYAFPLFYPEWAIPSVVYLKRLHLNMFGDWARAGFRPLDGEGDRVYEQWISVGVDLVAHVHLLGFFSPFDVGLRTTYTTDTRNVNSRLLMSFDLW